MVPVFKNVGKRCTNKNYDLFNLLFVLVDHLETCCLFSDFQYGVRSSQSTVDFLTVVSDGIARAFNRSRAT